MNQKAKTNSLKVKVSPEIGTISAISMIPPDPFAVITIAHGAGAGMKHPFMEDLAKSLAEVGIATIRFNFPFMEQQKRRPDVPALAHKTIAAVIVKATKLFPGL